MSQCYLPTNVSVMNPQTRYRPPERGAYTWEDQLKALFAKSDMEVEEFERLLEVALEGRRPDHPDLPNWLPLPLKPVLPEHTRR